MPPFRREHDAPICQFGNRRGFGALAIDAQCGNVGCERRAREPGDEARESQPGQRALQYRGPRAYDFRARQFDDPGRARHVGPPCPVPQRDGQLMPIPVPPAPNADHCERNGRGRDHQAALDPGARCIDQEQRYREQRQVEERVQQNRRQQPEAQEDQRPQRRGQQQLDQPRIRREPRIIGVRPGEYHRLQQHGEDRPMRALAEARAKQRGQ